MNEAVQKVVAAVNDENPEKIWAGIPREKRELLPNEICKLLMNNDLSFQQAELLLEVAKGRLRRSKI